MKLKKIYIFIKKYIDKIQILDRYLLTELAGSFCLAVGGFIIFMFADILFILADQIINKKVPALVILQMLFLKIPAILVLTFPVATLFATLLGLGRLASQNELTALRTSGVSFFRIVKTILISAVIITVLTFITNEKIVPWANHKSENIVRKMILRQSIPFVTPNVFIRGPNSRVFYVGNADNRNAILYNVMIFELGEGKFPRIITADKATYDSAQWYLEKGLIHKFDADGLVEYEVAFDKMSILVNVDPETFFTAQKSPHEMSIKELTQQVAMFAKSGANVNESMVDLYFKYSLPFASIICCIIAAPLSVRFPRSGKMLGIAFSILIIFVYYALLSISRALGKNGVIDPFIAAWLPNLILGTIGAYLIWKEDR